jgi:hypothetical protein
VRLFILEKICFSLTFSVCDSKKQVDFLYLFLYYMKAYSYKYVYYIYKVISGYPITGSSSSNIFSTGEDGLK